MSPFDHVDERMLPGPSVTAAKGIVWADILAEIAADEEARQRRAAETRQLRDTTENARRPHAVEAQQLRDAA